MKPLKVQFKSYVIFSDNIDDSLVNPRINDAFTYEIEPKLGDLAAAINNAVTLENELLAFYEAFVLPWWILLSYKRFVSTHGINIAQYGIIKMSDPDGTYTQSTASEIAIIIKQVTNDANVLETKCIKELNRINWTLDNVKYVKPEHHNKIIENKSFGIRPIK